MDEIPENRAAALPSRDHGVAARVGGPHDMEWSTWVSIGTICSVGAASPGPSLAMVVRNTMAGGRTRGALCGLGHGLGVGIYAFGAVAGFSALVETVPGLQRGIEVLGALFLMYLGVQSLKHAGAGRAAFDEDGPPDGSSGFREGFLVSFLNPKIAVFFLALLGTFVPDKADLTDRAGVALLAMVIDACWYVSVAMVLDGLGVVQWLTRHAEAVDRALQPGNDGGACLCHRGGERHVRSTGFTPAA